MKLTAQLKLLPSAEQTELLLATMRRFNAACDYIANVAFQERCANKVLLQQMIYHQIREQFGLSAQMAIRAIAKVVEVYKRDRSIKPTFRPLGAIVYDDRILSWKGPDRVSILTLSGREQMPYVCGAHQRALLGRVQGQADLVYRDGHFFLYATIDVPDATPFEPIGALGVDFGIKNIAVDSDGEVFAGALLNGLRARHHRLRQKLQTKGTKSARRLLKARRRKEREFAANTNHRIAKHLVRKAMDTKRLIALENLEGIRERITVRRPQRRTHHGWAFRQLRSFIEYKAKLAGVSVVVVDPRHTSQTCPCCGHIAKANRPSRDHFSCQLCGHAAPADLTAAIVIGGRAEVMRPNAGAVIDGHLQVVSLS